MKHYAPGGNKLQGKSQGHKVIDLGVIWKSVISGVYMPNMKSISYSSKVSAKVKVDNRQTNRQDKNNMPQSFDPGA